MNLNLDFCAQDIDLSDKDKLILDKIKDIPNIEYEEYISEMSLDEYNELSNFRLNILNWYEFKNKKNVLEIGNSYGILTNYLSSIFGNVVNIDYNKQRAENISKKIKDLENVEIIVGKLKNIEFKCKFDYILVCSDQVEYSKIYDGSLTEYISFLKNLLNDDGIIIIAIDNKFGVKYISGGKDLSRNVIGNSFLSSSGKKNPFYSRNKLVKIFEECNFDNYKFYYPLPDYRIPSVIFTDDFLPQKNDGKLLYALNYSDDSLVIYNENNFIRQLSNDGYFKDFTNSYIVELSNKNNFNDDIYISFNNLRKKEFRTITKIKKDKVIKLERERRLNDHIKNIAKNIEVLLELGVPMLDCSNKHDDDYYIESKYCSYNLLSSYLIELIKEEKIDEVYEIINKWIQLIKNKLGINLDKNDIEKKNIFIYFDIEVTGSEKEKLNKMNYTKNGFIDLIFENIFYDNNTDDMYFFDQEWYFENVPIEYIIYRSINNIFLYGNIEKYISLDTVLEKYNIYEYKELFSKLEKKLQEYIIDQKVLSSIKKTYNVIKSLPQIAEENNSIKQELSKVDTLLKEEREENKILKEKLKSKETELNTIYNSKSWKMINHVKNTLKGKRNENN